MPNYTYQCQKCQDKFDINQRLADKPLKRCKKCKGKLIKQIGVPMVYMKNRTVGAIADNNDNKLSSDYKETIIPSNTKINNSFGSNNKLSKKLSKLKPNEAQQYIETGKINGKNP